MTRDQVKQAKPDRDLFLAAAEQFGAHRDCSPIDNSICDVLAAAPGSTKLAVSNQTTQKLTVINAATTLSTDIGILAREERYYGALLNARYTESLRDPPGRKARCYEAG